jgi:hypothetical protein
MTRIYHVTTAAAASAILTDGFEDRSGWFFGDGRGRVRGTFFCGWPAHDLPGAPATEGGTVLAVDIPASELRPYFIQGHNPEPMWILPATVVNRRRAKSVPNGGNNDR